MSQKYDALKIGDTASYSKQITEAHVIAFADLSGDHNPIHLDESYAKNSLFKTRIAHGALVASLFSSVIAAKLPGEGTIYLEQDSTFMKPVYLDDTITVTVAVEEKFEKGRIKLSTVAKNQNDDVVIKGHAIIKI